MMIKVISNMLVCSTGETEERKIIIIQLNYENK